VGGAWAGCGGESGRCGGCPARPGYSTGQLVVLPMPSHSHRSLYLALLLFFSSPYLSGPFHTPTPQLPCAPCADAAGAGGGGHLAPANRHAAGQRAAAASHGEAAVAAAAQDSDGVRAGLSLVGWAAALPCSALPAAASTPACDPLPAPCLPTCLPHCRCLPATAPLMLWCGCMRRCSGVCVGGGGGRDGSRGGVHRIVMCLLAGCSGWHHAVQGAGSQLVTPAWLHHLKAGGQDIAPLPLCCSAA
jgi:hypothetical protein